MKEFRSLKMAINQYEQIKSLGLKGEIRSQIERAALSVALNLSEGDAKHSQKDRARFFNIAYASQKELQTILLIIGNTRLTDSADRLGAMIFCLQRQLLSTGDW